eukprot:scaffold423483_cov14-Prasinocladus_malaysianus.AAC.1
MAGACHWVESASYSMRAYIRLLQTSFHPDKRASNYTSYAKICRLDPCFLRSRFIHKSSND